MTCVICREPTRLTNDYGCEYCVTKVPGTIALLAMKEIETWTPKEATVKTPERIVGFEFNQLNWMLFPAVLKRLCEVDRRPEGNTPEGSFPISRISWIDLFVRLATPPGVSSDYLITGIGTTWEVVIPDKQTKVDEHEGMLYNPIDGRYRWL